MYKLLYLNPDDDSAAFRPKDFADKFLQNQTPDKPDKSARQRQDKRMEKAKNFFKKLQGFDLLREAEETKTDLAKVQSQMSIPTLKSATQSSLSASMPVATILTRAKTMSDPESEFMNKPVKLDPGFQSNLLEIQDESFPLQFVTPSKGRSKSDFSKIEQDSTERW